MKNTPYNSEAYKLFNQILTQRKMSCMRRSNRKPDYKINSALIMLEPYHRIHKADIGWARFFIKYEDEIRTLIIGTHKKTISRFDDILEESKLLTNK